MTSVNCNLKNSFPFRLSDELGVLCLCGIVTGRFRMGRHFLWTGAPVRGLWLPACVRLLGLGLPRQQCHNERIAYTVNAARLGLLAGDGGYGSAGCLWEGGRRGLGAYAVSVPVGRVPRGSGHMLMLDRKIKDSSFNGEACQREGRATNGLTDPDTLHLFLRWHYCNRCSRGAQGEKLGNPKKNC